MDVQIFEWDVLYHTAADMFADAVNQAMNVQGTFAVALSGGETPEPFYALLAERYSESIPWEQVQVFFGDERCVPPDEPDSNFEMVDRLLLSRVAISPQNVHRMRGEIDPEEAAAEYEQEIHRVLGNDIPRFDLILLGMGDDGHTASLFPCGEALHETQRLVVPVDDDEHEHSRLTITPPVILSARETMVLVTGEDKSKALARVLDGPYQPDVLPIQILLHAQCEVNWLIDTEAACRLEPTVR
jgi:6-phosphogluconolactonase